MNMWFKPGCFGLVSGVTLLLLSGVPSSLFGFDPGLIAWKLIVLVIKLIIYFEFYSNSKSAALNSFFLSGLP
jgi:hypothetical protein